MRELAVPQRRCRVGDLLPRRRHVRPLRAGDRRRDHLPLRVPDPLHALSAGDLPGRPAGDVRVPDGDDRADRAAALERRPLRGPLDRRGGRLPGDRRDPAAAGSSSPAASTRSRRETLATYCGGYPAEVDEVAARRRPHRPRGARRRGRRRDRRRLRPVPELPRRGRGPRADRRGSPTMPAPCWSPPATRSRSASSALPATAASTSPSARASRSATASTTAGRRSASSAPPMSRSGGCRAGSPARRPTSTAAAASCSRCRPASSTSAARRPPTTSAPPRR